MKIRFKKLNGSAVVPTYAKPGDAAMDLTATSVSETAHFIEYGTGLALEIPDGYVGLVFPRSSVSNVGLILANSVGVIDSKYRGEVKLRFKKVFDVRTYSDKIYKVGERVGQLMVVPYPQMEMEEALELNETDRGAGGFGSTGSK